MINLTTNNTTYKIPNKMGEINIEKYRAITAIKIDDKYKQFRAMLNVLNDDVTDSIVSSIPATDLNGMINSIAVGLLDSSPVLQDIIKVKGVKYKLEDKLVNVRFDQFMDLFEYTDDEQLTNDNLHIIMAIMYRKVIKEKKEKFRLRHILPKNKRCVRYITEEYNSDEILEQAEIFNTGVNMNDVLGLLGFFLQIKLKYISNSQSSLNNQENQSNQKTQK